MKGEGGKGGKGEGGREAAAAGAGGCHERSTWFVPLFVRCHHTHHTLYDPQGSEVALLIRE